MHKVQMRDLYRKEVWGPRGTRGCRQCQAAKGNLIQYSAVIGIKVFKLMMDNFESEKKRRNGQIK